MTTAAMVDFSLHFPWDSWPPGLLNPPAVVKSEAVPVVTPGEEDKPPPCVLCKNPVLPGQRRVRMKTGVAHARCLQDTLKRRAGVK